MTIESEKKGEKKRVGSQRYAERAWFLFSLFTTRFWGMDDVTIEDLAFGIRSSREPDGVIKKRT
jgi:hypothetical protein